jgi:hypothetical protein
LQIIRIHEHEQQFDLTNPTEVIHLYVFCVKLERSLRKNIIPKLQKYEPPTEMKIHGLKWRSPDLIPWEKGTASDSTSNLGGDNSDRNGGSGSHGGDSGGNGDGRNAWSKQLKVWKNEALEGAREASVISGEGQSLTGRHLRRFTSRNTT